MARVTDIRVTYERTVQPRQYESIKAGVELAAVVSEAEADTWGDAAVALLHEAREKAHEAIRGHSGKTAEDASIETTKEPAKKADKSKAAAGKKASSKKAEKPAEKPAEEAASGDVDIDDIEANPPAGDIPAPQDDGPDLDDIDSDQEAFDESVEADIPDSELQAECSKASRRVGAEKVKAAIKEFGVARIAELPADKRQAFVDALGALKK